MEAERNDSLDAASIALRASAETRAGWFAWYEKGNDAPAITQVMYTFAGGSLDIWVWQ